MPVGFGLEVCVVNGDSTLNDREREAYREYGTRTIQACDSKARTVSTKIESKTDDKFFIRVKPVGPFPVGPLDAPTDYVDTTSYLNYLKTGRGFNECPYSIGINIYIDGQSRSEQDSVMHNIQPRDDIAAFVRGRTVAVGRNHIGEPLVEVRGWKFGELGIEVQMQNLQIAIDNLQHDPTSYINENKIGQIVVRLDRCIIGGYSTILSEQIVGNARTNKQHAVHELTTTHEMELTDVTTPRYYYNSKTTSPYIAGEDTYATFVFQYMNREKLMKLGLCDRHGNDIQRLRALSLASHSYEERENRHPNAQAMKRKNLDDDDYDDNFARPQFTMVLRPHAKRQSIRS